MSDESDQTLAVLRTFLDDVHVAAPGDLPTVVLRAADRLGWTARLYVADYEQRVLVPVPSPGLPDAEPVLIDGTLAGRAFRQVEPVPVTGGSRLTLWLPLLDGVHRFGVIQLGLPASTDVDDPVVRDRYRLLAHVTGHLFAAKAAYGDALEILSRRRHRSVPSELLWGMLPPLTFGCEGLLVSGLLEPTYAVAADAFDYSVVDRVAHLAVFDATGHDLNGTLLAAVALAAYRNSRRERRSLFDTATAIDQTLAEQWDHLFATGVLGQLDLRTGRLRYINAGHPAPLLMRRGKVVKQLDGGRRIVLGLGRGEGQVAEEFLEPDDWVVFYTDGITEARDPDGGFYGIQRLSDQLERSAASGYPAPETLRRVIREVLDHQHQALQDDATILVAQWASGREHTMTADPKGLI